jgi:ribosomal protein S18 acetylase RimI-like enzyme
MDIRTFHTGDGILMKQIRLRALADAPYAFGGTQTLAEESALPDSHWHQLAAEVGGDVPEWRDRCISFVVFDGDEPCGTGSSFLCSRVPRRAYFSAAWIDPRYRRRGLGRRLVDDVIEWATAHGADHIRLWVDDTNPGAAKFYEALGFRPTGESRPVSPGSSLCESSYERRLCTR